jgi:hypothetical protein
MQRCLTGETLLSARMILSQKIMRVEGCLFA